MWKREHCDPAALETSADHAPAAHETEALVGALERKKDLVLSAPPRVDDAEVADTPVDAACGSNPSRGWAQTRRPLDAKGRSPGVAFWWHCHSIDTAHAEHRDGNCGCWRHTPRVGCHRPPCAAPVPQAPDRRGHEAFHAAGGGRLARRSGQPSRAERRPFARHPEEGRGERACFTHVE